MKQQNVYSTEQIEKILNDEAISFHKKWHGIMSQSELQTIAKYIEQVKEKINQVTTIPC